MSGCADLLKDWVFTSHPDVLASQEHRQSLQADHDLWMKGDTWAQSIIWQMSTRDRCLWNEVYQLQQKQAAMVHFKCFSQTKPHLHTSPVTHAETVKLLLALIMESSPGNVFIFLMLSLQIVLLLRKKGINIYAWMDVELFHQEGIWS